MVQLKYLTRLIVLSPIRSVVGLKSGRGFMDSVDFKTGASVSGQVEESGWMVSCLCVWGRGGRAPPDCLLTADSSILCRADFVFDFTPDPLGDHAADGSAMEPRWGDGDIPGEQRFVAGADDMAMGERSTWDWEDEPPESKGTLGGYS